MNMSLKLPMAMPVGILKGPPGFSTRKRSVCSPVSDGTSRVPSVSSRLPSGSRFSDDVRVSVRKIDIAPLAHADAVRLLVL